MTTAEDDVVATVGRSVCSSYEELDGPAPWTATVRTGRIAEWRVYEDTAENRQHLAIADRRANKAVRFNWNAS